MITKVKPKHLQIDLIMEELRMSCLNKIISLTGMLTFCSLMMTNRILNWLALLIHTCPNIRPTPGTIDLDEHFVMVYSAK
jgi:hypothetical protein